MQSKYIVKLVKYRDDHRYENSIFSIEMISSDGLVVLTREGDQN